MVAGRTGVNASPGQDVERVLSFAAVQTQYQVEVVLTVLGQARDHVILESLVRLMEAGRAGQHVVQHVVAEFKLDRTSYFFFSLFFFF